MDFPIEYFEDEIRDGFYVPGVIKCAWAAQMEVLEEIDKVCKKHNIKYYLDFGSLLGAIRHGGPIPWDDDMDISMMREDLEKFKKVCMKELPKGFSMLAFSDSDSDYWEYIVRIINSKSFELTEERMNKYHFFPFPAGIDIFCLDNVPDEDGESEIIFVMTRLIQQVADYIEDPESSFMSESDFEAAIKGIEDLTKQKIDRKGDMRRQLYMLNDVIFSIYSGEKTNYIGFMPKWIKSEGRYKFKRERYEGAVQLPFEHTTFPVPKEYEIVIHTTYGKNYMEPRKDSGAHDYPFVKKQEAEVKPKIGEAPFVYTFNEDDLKNDERMNGRNVKQQAIAFADILSQIHVKIREYADNGDIENAMNALVNCQNTAISIGTMIENCEGEGCEAVRKLEEYCEHIFASFKDFESGNFNVSDMYEKLEALVSEYKKSVIHSMSGKLEVLFIPYKKETWSMMEEEYNKYKDDPECNVFVMPVPWYHKTPLGVVVKNHYELDGFDSNLNLVVFDKYDIKKRHPDIIYIQNPYDQYNFITSIHPTFYSSELKKHTEKLVYMPYFKEMNFTIDDQKDVYNMKYYATVPGVINADEVILRSDNEKSLYVEKLSEFAGEKTRELWEKKIVVK